MKTLFIIALLLSGNVVFGQSGLPEIYKFPSGTIKIDTTKAFRLFNGNAYSSLSIGIGTATPAAKLDIASTTSGILSPRMSVGQRDGINTSGANAAALEGMQIYNLTTHAFNYWNGTVWKEIASTP